MALKEETTVTLKQIDRFLRELRKEAPKMSLAQAHAFILVALNEGISARELARTHGSPESSISRAMLDLSHGSRYEAERPPLVLRDQDPNELRRNRYVLTVRGKHLLDSTLGGA